MTGGETPTSAWNFPPSSLDRFPSLDDLPAGRLRVSFAGRAFFGDISLGEPARSRLFNAVRLAEKALAEYNAGRAHVATLVLLSAEGSFSVAVMMEGIDAIENCIITTHRGFQFVASLRKAPSDAIGETLFDEKARLELRALEVRIRQLRTCRDAIEHRNEDLAKTRPADDAAFARVDGNQTLIGTSAITHVDLARLVRGLFELACLSAGADVY